MMKTSSERLFDVFTSGFRGVLEPLPLRMIKKPTSEFTPVVDVSESERHVSVTVGQSGMQDKDMYNREIHRDGDETYTCGSGVCL
jgi:hypothetical protein